jgi:hypothetical protein
MFSSDENIETIGQLVNAVKRYVDLQGDYFRFTIVDKIVRLVTALVVTAVLALLAAFVLIYLSFALAYAIASFTGMAWAFCFVAGLYVLVMILFAVNRHNWIERPMVRFLADLLLK